MKFIAAALLGALVAVILVSGSPAQAITATPPPTETPPAPTEPPPTRTPSPPAAPSRVRLVDGALVWVDNSADEDGFRILIRVGSFRAPLSVRRYEVSPNITRFVVPPRKTALLRFCGEQSWLVSSFNEFGESPSAGIISISACTVEVTPTPTSLRLPESGTGTSDTDRSAWLLPTLLAVGAALVSLSALILKIVRRPVAPTS